MVDSVTFDVQGLSEDELEFAKTYIEAYLNSLRQSHRLTSESRDAYEFFIRERQSNQTLEYSVKDLIEDGRKL